jgi:hypothetical protein
MSQGGGNPNVSTQGSSVVRPIFFGDYAAADEGSYYTAWLATTAGTAVATTTQALGTVNPAIVVYNQNPVGGYNIYMRTVKLRFTTVNTGSTTIEQVGVLAPNIANLTTVGTALSSPNSVNSASGTTSKAIIYGGVNVVTAPTAIPGARIVHTGPVASIIPIVLDSWNLSYGDVSVGAGFNAVIGTTGGTLNVNLPPVIIAPQWYYALSFWGASTSTTAPIFRVDVAYIERPSGQ